MRLSQAVHRTFSAACIDSSDRPDGLMALAIVTRMTKVHVELRNHLPQIGILHVAVFGQLGSSPHLLKVQHVLW